MGFLGLAFILVIIIFSKTGELEKKIKFLDKKVKLSEKNHKGVSEMSKLISDLKGQRCKIKSELNPLTLTKESIECDILDVDEEWVKVSFIDKKGFQKTKIIRIESIEDIELL